MNWTEKSYEIADEVMKRHKGKELREMLAKAAFMGMEFECDQCLHLKGHETKTELQFSNVFILSGV